jgi:hypothetical protein
VLAIFFTIGTNFVRVTFQNGFGNAQPEVWSFVSGYPFSFVLMGAFAALNGLFGFLMRAPTALGRPIMDQLSGFRLYLETAEADRLNLQAPRDHCRTFRGTLALRGRPRRGKAVGAGLRGGAAPYASRRGRSDVALPAGLE